MQWILGFWAAHLILAAAPIADSSHVPPPLTFKRVQLSHLYPCARVDLCARVHDCRLRCLPRIHALARLTVHGPWSESDRVTEKNAAGQAVGAGVGGQ